MPDLDNFSAANRRRSSWLRPFDNFKVFLVVFLLQSMLQGIHGAYLRAVLTTLEKRFSWESSMTGLLVSTSLIGGALVSVFVGHFGKRWHKPKVLGISMLLTACASFLCVTPHIFFGPGDVTFEQNNIQNVTAASGATKSSFCSLTRTATMPNMSFEGSNLNNSSRVLTDGTQREKQTSATSPESTISYVIFFFAQLLYGIAMNPAWNLGIPFMDANVKTSNSVFTLGVWVGFRFMAPVLAFIMGSFTLKLPVDLQPTDLTPEHPRWLGAWWLGYVICACAVVPLSFLMFLFPREFSGTGKNAEESEQEEKERVDDAAPSSYSFMDDLKDLPRALGRLVRNLVYILCVLGLCVDVLQYGHYAFLLKYLEIQYQQTAYLSSVYGGMLPNFLSMALSIISGAVLSRMKRHTTFTYTRIVAVLAAVCSVCIAGQAFLSCPEIPLAGRQSDKVNLTFHCNANCSCPFEKIDPVCGSDGLVYYSPCHAGCPGQPSNATAKGYSDCSCIPDGEALRGFCPSTCTTLVPYLVIGVLWSIAFNFYNVPAVQNILRLTDERDRSLALSLFGVLVSASLFPAPMIYGKAVDDTCFLSTPGSTSGQRSACQLYDRKDIRLKLHGLTLAFQILAVLIYTAAAARAWRNEKRTERKRKMVENKEVQLKLMDGTKTEDEQI